MTTRLRTLALVVAAVLLTACGKKGRDPALNWGGRANTDYSQIRTVYYAPVVQTRTRRVGTDMIEAYKRAIMPADRVPGLRTGAGMLSSVVRPSGGSRSFALPVVALRANTVALPLPTLKPSTVTTMPRPSAVKLPPIGRRRLR